MNYDQLIATCATQAGLEPKLIIAQVMVESGGNPWAWKPEPRYRYFWDVRKNTAFRPVTMAESASELPPVGFRSLAGSDDQEWWAQQASWGLMQIMGALARELGFRGAYLPEICDVPLNLSLGCTHMARLMKWANGDVERALAAYNGGRLGNTFRPLRNQEYATKVMSLL